ncbi:MAG TPA: DNA polymerase/3'-5' exonuclease PolX [Opitutales bacterium]|nr:DNA polymerase/3'-5' exonuclease PolX [Opitutales bacterium]
MRVLLELLGENPFKVRAYEGAVRTLETLNEDLGTLIAQKRLKGQPGIGAAIAEKIEELYTTGALPYYIGLKKQVPAGLLEWLSIPGLGPKRARALHIALGIETLEELKQACEDGRVAAVAGFGAKTAQNILHGMAQRAAYGARYLWWTVQPQAEAIIEGLRALPGVSHAEMAGSYRRKLETVGDLDCLVAAQNPQAVMDWFVSRPGVEAVTAHGDTKSSVRLDGGLQVDLRVVPQAQFAFALHHFTGSKDHNVKMRHRALTQGLSLSEWGLRQDREQGAYESFGVDSETKLFAHLGLHYIEPELREGSDEIDLAEQGELPRLIELGDLRGAFHNHTQASDGEASLEEMAAGAEVLGWEYLGISDHSKSSWQANGLSEARLLEQVATIHQLNEAQRFKVHLFAGVECDILKDGTLDYEDAVLAELDYVVASVHSSFSLDEAAMTARIIRALENPYVTMLGHPTGRLLLKREPYAVNMAKVIDAAIANRKIIELNATPQRLDMDWRLWRRASERGLLCSINPDAHSVEGLGFVRAGVNVARKGFLQKHSVFNTRTLSDIKQYLNY